MKANLKWLVALIAIAMTSMLQATPTVERVEPLCWWTEMQCPLQLMVQGEDLSDANISIQRLVNGKTAGNASKALKVTGQHNAESPNYLFIDLSVKEPGTYRFTLKKDGKKCNFDYTIYERQAESRNRQSFTTADVIYLLMPDRFVDGDETNNNTPDTQEKSDKQDVISRYGGDIAGIEQAMDHIAELGATAIWSTPLLSDDEPRFSYHGYACSDYYHIDSRFGNNEQYKAMVEKAHQKGLKVIMDMVPNHCGGAHWWMKDLPYSDWVNQWDKFTTTNNIFSANYDIHASQYDKQLNNQGWFDRPMPDMNLQNPDLLHYFTQWAIWWIEYAGLDGLRVDTYPYVEPEASNAWVKGIRDEYPNMNIVGECWTRPTSAVAYWQAGVKNYNGFESQLPTVMDFPLEEAIRQALGEDGTAWGAGTMRIYETVAQDYLYADVNRLMIFLGNHDTEHITDVVKDNSFKRVQLAYVLLATLRGIPQIFAGDEYGMRSSDMRGGHSTLRRPLPKASELTPEQQELFTFQSRLLQFRKTEPILHNGKMMHFASRDNTYAYVRYTDDGAVFVFVNASEEERTIPVAHYQEILSRYNVIGQDVLTGKTVDLSTTLNVEGLSAVVVKLVNNRM